MEAQLEQRDGGWQLRFVRKLPHSVDKVWQAITEPGFTAAGSGVACRTTCFA